MVEILRYNRKQMPDKLSIRLGTSAFTAAGWEGTFYPEGLPEREYLTYYAQHFDTVEVDSTFYRTPSKSTVQAWAQKTPEGFLFAAKIPQIITHEKVLVDSRAWKSRHCISSDLLDPLRVSLFVPMIRTSFPWSPANFIAIPRSAYSSCW
jgi:uncharacterized protein YecE (DUF72 family)